MSDMQPEEQAAIARRLLRSVDAGVLATISLDVAGYPFGSVTPFVMDHGGRPLIYVSTIAQHTRNMDADARVSLTVLDAGAAGENRQALGRATVIADARPLPQEQLDAGLERYFALFPEAREYAGTHGFHLYALEPVRVRFIGGFGKIYWVEPEDWRVPEPAWASGEAGIVAHMNDDHADALLAIARAEGASDCARAEMLALDPDGFHLRTESGVRYIELGQRCLDATQVREAMVALTRASRSAN